MKVVIKSASEVVGNKSPTEWVPVMGVLANGFSQGLLPVRAITNHLSTVVGALPAESSENAVCILADTPFFENGCPQLYCVVKGNRQCFFAAVAGDVSGDTLFAFRVND